MRMRDIFVEHEPNGDNAALGGEWVVFTEDAWLASFINEEDAHDYADLQRLRP